MKTLSHAAGIMNGRVPTPIVPFITANSVVVRAPGRINLIGEHTDYNDGFVLPAAIDKAAWVALDKRTDDLINLYALDYDERLSINTSYASQKTGTCFDFILGVVEQFRRLGFTIPGFDLALTSNIPQGAGLSSSAAIECGVALALNELTKAGLDKLSLARISQQAENEFVGVRCGIMDQVASMFGISGHAIRLDCRSLNFEYITFPTERVKIVLFNTGVSHSLALSEYNTRRRECELGLAWINEQRFSAVSFRDITVAQLNKCGTIRNPAIYRRCQYVVEENLRVVKGCEDLKAGNLKAFGQKMFKTHDGLRYLYEVSCPELDFLIDRVRGNPDVFGARMMGGGFGGCTINLIRQGNEELLVEEISTAYRQIMKRDLAAYSVSIEDGCMVFNNQVTPH